MVVAIDPHFAPLLCGRLSPCVTVAWGLMDHTSAVGDNRLRTKSSTEDSWLICHLATSTAALTIRGPHTNVRRGPFSSTQSPDFLICGGLAVHFFPQKCDDLF